MATLLFTVAAPATGQDDPARYDYCVGLAGDDPATALDLAAAWMAETGGDSAEHCLALALLGLGHYDRAADTLEGLAALIDAPPPTAAMLFAKAGEAWLLADMPDRALTAFARAHELTPDDPERLIDQARANAAADQYENALALLNEVLADHPDRDDALVFRAVAWRQLDMIEDAAADLALALALNPANGDALVERGILWLAQDDAVAARRDFSAALIAAPNSPAADLARTYLDTMDDAGAGL